MKVHAEGIEAEERARIAQEIIDGLDEEAPEEGVEQDWEDQLARLTDEIDAGTVEFERWSRVGQALDDMVHGWRSPK